jgi:hypothetical protein
MVISTYEEKNHEQEKKKSLTAVQSQGGQPSQAAAVKCCRGERCWKRKSQTPSDVNQEDERE